MCTVHLPSCKLRLRKWGNTKEMVGQGMRLELYLFVARDVSEKYQSQVLVPLGRFEISAACNVMYVRR